VTPKKIHQQHLPTYFTIERYPNNIKPTGIQNLPRRSNWNLSPMAASLSDGTAYAPDITTLDCRFTSESQSSCSAGF